MVLRECWSHLLLSSRENADGGPFLVSVAHLRDHSICDSPLSIRATLLLLLIRAWLLPTLATHISQSFSL